MEDVTKWKCFEEVASVLGEDQAEHELKRVLMQINNGEIIYGSDGKYAPLNLAEDYLIDAFKWRETVRGHKFWKSIERGAKPDNYDTTPDVPPTPKVDKYNMAISDSVLGDGLSEIPKDENLSIGSLVEDLYNNLPDSGVQIVISGAGIYLTGLNMPTVNISKMQSEVIDKAFEMFVECEGLWVLPEEGFEESEEN